MTAIQVVKIGGSLLAHPAGVRRVAAWLDSERRPEESRLLIAGGGPAVEGLRAIDRANPLPASASHLAAIEMMDANTRLLASWLPDIRLSDAMHASGAGDVATLVSRWIRETEHRVGGERIRAGWQTTSDAIAARLAAVLGVRLTVLKHTVAVTYGDLAAAAHDGVIDAEAPRVARGAAGWRLIGLVSPGVTPPFSDFPDLKLDETLGRDSTA